MLPGLFVVKTIFIVNIIALHTLSTNQSDKQLKKWSQLNLVKHLVICRFYFSVETGTNADDDGPKDSAFDKLNKALNKSAGEISKLKYTRKCFISYIKMD